MNLVTRADFARLCGVKAQSIGTAIKKGQLNVVNDGKRGKIDIDDYKSACYRNNLNAQRTSPPEDDEKPPSDLIVDPRLMSDQEILNSDNAALAKQREEILLLTKRVDVARTERLEEQALSEKLKNAKMRGELISREVVYDSLFVYLDLLHSNIERLADSFLSDVGGRIIDSDGVTPEIRHAWKNEVLSQIDSTKKEIVKKLKKAEKANGK